MAESDSPPKSPIGAIVVRAVLVAVVTAGSWAAGYRSGVLVVAALAIFVCFLTVMAKPVRLGGLSYRASMVVTAVIIGLLVVAEGSAGLTVSQRVVACPATVLLDVQQRLGLKGSLRAMFGAAAVDFSIENAESGCVQDSKDRLVQPSGAIGFGAQDLRPGEQTVRLTSAQGVVETKVSRPRGLLELKVPSRERGGFEASVAIDGGCGGARMETAEFDLTDQVLEIELMVRGGARFERLGGTLGVAAAAPDGGALHRDWSREQCAWSRLRYQVSLLDFAYDIKSPEDMNQSHTLELKIADEDGSEAKVTVTGHLLDKALSRVLEPYHRLGRGRDKIAWAPDVAPLGASRPYLIIEKDDAFGWHLGNAPLKAVQLVVGIEASEKTVGQCYYSSGWSGSSENLKRSDRKVTIYEARTGKQRTQQTFYGPHPTCPSFTRSEVVGKPPARATIETWAEATIKRLNPPGPAALPVAVVPAAAQPASPRPAANPRRVEQPADGTNAASEEAAPGAQPAGDPPSASFDG
jgi:hypothetical protein